MLFSPSGTLMSLLVEHVEYTASSWLQNDNLENKMLEFPPSLIFQKLQCSLVQCNFLFEVAT